MRSCHGCSVQFTILITAFSHSPQIEATVGEAKKRLMGQLEGYSIHAKRQAETIRDKHNAKTEPNKREEL